MGILFIPILSYGQSSVSLVLKDESSLEVIEGVTVYDRTNDNVYTSDGEGKVFISKLKNSTLSLEMRHLNYQDVDTIFTAEHESSLVFYLTKKTTEIDRVDVFHTGYDQIPKERQTGSFVGIDKEALSRQSGLNVLDRLPALTPGLMMDNATASLNAPAIRIRGLSSIRGQKDPLIILDDFPYEGDINNINPNDVESITILRDAAASSIWGAKAGNGVIVITTSKAKKGQDVNFTFSSTMGMSSKPDLYYGEGMDAASFIEVEKFLFDNGFYDSYVSVRTKPALSQAVELLQAHKEGSLDELELEEGLYRLQGMDGKADFEKYVYRKPVLSQNFIQASGAKDNYGWLVSAGYDKKQDELANSTKRLTFRTNQQFEFFDQFKINLNVRMTDNKEETGRSGINNIRTSFGDLPPYERLVDDGGEPRAIMYGLRPSAVEEVSEGRLLDWSFTPLEDDGYMDRTVTTKELNINPTLSYTHKSGLSIMTKYNYMMQQHVRDNVYGIESYHARNLINSFTQFQADGTPLYNIPMGGVKNLSRTDVITHNGRLQLGFNRSFHLHRVDFLGGGEVIATDSPNSTQVLYGFDKDTYVSESVNYTESFPHVITRSRSYIPGGNGVAMHKRRFVSLFTNASYTYNAKYAASFSLRRDASNFFGIAANDSWNPLGSLGFSWDVGKESFFRNSLFTEFKLRATYGKSGNINRNMVALTTIAHGGNSFLTNRRMARVNNFVNPELRWETVSTFNLGLDMALMKNRLRGNIEVYRKLGNDLFGTSPMDYTTGVGYQLTKNVAKMKTQGLDISLNSVNLKGKLSWNTDINWSFNKDKVLSYFLTNTYGRDFVGNSTIISAIEGKPVYGMYSYAWAGLDPETGRARGYVNGEASTDFVAITGTETDITDLAFHGSAIPKMFGSLGNYFRYGDFDLDVRMLFKFSYFLRRTSIGYYSLFYDHVTHSDYYDRWQQPGDETKTEVPALMYPYSNTEQSFYSYSEPLVYDASHIRLQYVRLGWNGNFSLGSKGHRTNANLFLLAENLGLVWKKNKHGIDPDFPKTLGRYPSPLRVSLGVKLNY